MPECTRCHRTDWREREIIESLRALQLAGLTADVMPIFDRLADQLDEAQEIIKGRK